MNKVYNSYNQALTYSKAARVIFVLLGNIWLL